MIGYMRQAWCHVAPFAALVEPESPALRWCKELPALLALALHNEDALGVLMRVHSRREPRRREVNVCLRVYAEVALQCVRQQRDRTPVELHIVEDDSVI